MPLRSMNRAATSVYQKLYNYCLCTNDRQLLNMITSSSTNDRVDQYSDWNIKPGSGAGYSYGKVLEILKVFYKDENHEDQRKQQIPVHVFLARVMIFKDHATLVNQFSGNAYCNADWTTADEFFVFLFHITRRIYLVPHVQPWIVQHGFEKQTELFEKSQHDMTKLYQVIEGLDL